MANELQLGASVFFVKNDGAAIDWSKSGILRTVAGNAHVGAQVVSVGTSEEVIPLGEVTAAKALIFGQNLDYTNYIEIRYATGASFDVVYVGPREPFMFRFGTDVTAPYWIANTAAVLVQYGLIPV